MKIVEVEGKELGEEINENSDPSNNVQEGPRIENGHNKFQIASKSTFRLSFCIIKYNFFILFIKNS